ncbi:uncharacterized protein LOC141627913 [Silene latifolia]|uniref:uncharacterized protein LOC141627913 n=1 Tax=Silene latifolia TaxID=37657 RepID=UPI003D76FA99
MAKAKKSTIKQNNNCKSINNSNKKNHKTSDLQSASTSKHNNNNNLSSPKSNGRPSLRVSPLRFEVDLEPIVEDVESEEEEVSAAEVPISKPVLQFLKEDVESEIQYWSTSVFYYILGANPPSTVVSGFVNRVWQANGVDKISFLPNGIFMVRFKTREQHQMVLNNGHLLFDNKPVIIKEWGPDVALIKHDVKKVPIWMKLYRLEVKFWGSGSLRKISEEVGRFIKCDDATASRRFFGFARVLFEMTIGQEFRKEFILQDELGLTQKVRVGYDWLPLHYSNCKGIGHEASLCRKSDAPKPAKKVWRPKRPLPVKPMPNPQRPTGAGPGRQTSPPVVSTPVPQPVPLQTPTVPVAKVVEGSSMPQRILTRMLRREIPESKQYTPQGIIFMDALNMTISKSNNVGLFGLLETKLKSRNWLKVKNNVCDSWSICTNNSHHKGGRIWLIWQPNQYVVDVRYISDQLIHSIVFDKLRNITFFFTMVYGLNKDKERESLWDSLCLISRDIDTAWLVGGDFNSLMHLNERVGGTEVTWSDISPMRQMVDQCDLVELKSIGSFFTWNNKHEVGKKVYSKLDRVLINGDWLAQFPECFANFLPEGRFDHCPCLIQFQTKGNRKGVPFKYFNMWAMSEEFQHTVVKKLKLLKKELKKLDKNNFSDIENLTQVTEVSLREVQQKLIEDPLNKVLCDAESALAKEVLTLRKARIQFLLQKSKEKWMEEGDENSAYYHQSIKKRRMRNRVYQIQSQDGVSCLSIQQEHELLAPVADEEVKRAMISIPGNKARGPDGYGSQFYKDAWPIVGKEVTIDVRNVIQTGKLLKECNATILTLIPKVEVPESVQKCRPIACCNTLYKCVTKDLIKMYKRKAYSPRVMMKIDLQKAYDSVEWSFLNDMLSALKFPEPIIRILMQCVTTPSYSLSLNGDFWVQNQREFRFHHFCKRVKLNHLCFADDLLMFCRGDIGSVVLMLRAFLYFSQASGLQMNKGKSNIYSNGVDEGTVHQLVKASGMKRGTIPFRYLGVNISPKRLSVDDCECLLDKITNRIKGVGARRLSYVGRLVLIKAVYSALHNYWARIFILPKTVLQQIESICRRFLWYGTDNRESPALVRWVHSVYIKDHDWIDYKPGRGSSWAWRKVCWAKELVKHHLLTTDNYSMKLGYTWLTNDGPDITWHPWTTTRLIIPRHGFIVSLTAHKRLLTQDRLIRMGITQTNVCFLCGCNAETVEHLFFRCPFSSRCLELAATWLKIALPDKGVIEWWVQQRARSLLQK